MVTYEHTLQLPIPAPSALALMLNTKKIQCLNSGTLLGSQPSHSIRFDQVQSHSFPLNHSPKDSSPANCAFCNKICQKPTSRGALASKKRFINTASAG